MGIVTKDVDVSKFKDGVLFEIWHLFKPKFRWGGNADYAGLAQLGDGWKATDVRLWRCAAGGSTRKKRGGVGDFLPKLESESGYGRRSRPRTNYPVELPDRSEARFQVPQSGTGKRAKKDLPQY